MLLALVAQWLLLVASATHHAQVAAAAGPWAQVCRSATGVASAGTPASGSSEMPDGILPCPVCAAVALVAPPPVPVDKQEATAPALPAAPRIHAAAVTARALPPPARAPPAV